MNKRYRARVLVTRSEIYEIDFDGPEDRIYDLLDNARGYDHEFNVPTDSDVTFQGTDVSPHTDLVAVDSVEEIEPEYVYGLDSQNGLPRPGDREGYMVPNEWVLRRYRKGQSMYEGEIVDRSPWFEHDMDRTAQEFNAMLLRNGMPHEMVRDKDGKAPLPNGEVHTYGTK